MFEVYSVNVTKQEILAWCEEHAGEQLALLRTLAAIPAPSHSEHKRVEFIREWLAREGAQNVRVDEALKAVNMYEFREHAPHLLSGGQKQRIAIAGVIAMEPRCVVLDEPTAMLDPTGRADVLRTIKALNQERGVTVVLITHHMDEAAQADRLVVMSKGRVVADGVPKEVFSHVEELKAVGLTVPQTTQLLWELRQEGISVPLDALSDEECAAALWSVLS